MRIPLDYYRILGVPIKATEAQIKQAYHDRALQLPRREYSDLAITARKQLLDQAYSILVSEDTRTAYDQEFLGQTYSNDDKQSLELPLQQAKTTEPEFSSDTPWIKIEKEQFVGAILILQELGEYELVIKLGLPYLNQQSNISIDQGLLGNPQMVLADIILTLALAYLELEREQWQQGHYEAAANSGYKGQDLLLQNGLFPSVRGEIQADLYKLRPYRILELLALSEDHLVDRRRGMQLLQEMLEERGGIDGTGDDQSGLSVDDFLRFVQQLRTYLKVDEQQELFEAEARRPSAVATYLAVYAFLANGFAQCRPEFVNKAQELLYRLSNRQDVYLEQAVCGLLLGQTDEANQALGFSQDAETLAFIRQQSQGAPDLLPGLCLYAERWLQTEVFSHFRDLVNHQASLKDYFANPQVQFYLEQLPVDKGSQDQWAIINSEELEMRESNPEIINSFGTMKNLKSRESANNYVGYTEDGNGKVTSDRAKAGLLTSPREQSSSYTKPEGTTVTAPKESSRPPSRRKQRQQSLKQPVTPIAGNSETNLQDFSGLNSLHAQSRRRNRPKSNRLLLLTFGGLLGLTALAFILVGAFKWLQQALTNLSTPPLQGQQLSIELSKPVLEIPKPGSKLIPPEMNQNTAQEVVETWLSSKKAAFGEQHQIDELNKILVEPLLSQQRGRALTIKKSNAYRKFEHKVTISKVNKKNENEATIEAQIQEKSQYYQGNNLSPGNSSNETLQVRYDLVLQNNQWMIKGIKVI